MKKNSILFCVIFILFHNHSYSQQNKIDSLKRFITTAKDDTIKVNALNALGKNYEFISQDSAVVFLKKAFLLSEHLKFEKGKGTAFTYLGYIAEDRSDFDSAKICYTSSYEIFKKIGDKSRQAEQLKMLGEVAKYQGDLKLALTYYQQSLETYEAINSLEGIAGVNYSLGGLYSDLLRNDKAMESYLKALDANRKANRVIDMANDLTAIGIIYDRLKDYKKAKKNYFEAKKIYEENQYDNGLSNLLTWIAITAYNEKDIPASLDYFQQSLKLYEKINNRNGLMYVYNNIGSIYTELGQLDKAIEWENKSLEMALQHKTIDNIKYAYEMLSETYAKKRDYKKAYESHKLFMQYKDSILNESTSKQLSELDKKFETEKKNKELIKKDAELLKQNAQIDKQNNQRNYLLLGLGLMVIIALFIFRSYRQKKKANEIIATQKLEVEYQKEMIEEKQKEIVDSITYAKRIQYTLLANKQLLDANLSSPVGGGAEGGEGYFVLFKPKDIVSGDFYWATKKVSRRQSLINKGKEEITERFYIAACDSTGHGVPGAFMSLLNISFLNEAVNEKNIVEPHEILNHVRKRLIENMDGGQDGMDCILLCFETTPLIERSPLSFGEGPAVRCTYAAANNSPCIIKNGELISLPADKMPVGKGENEVPFTLHTIDLPSYSNLNKKAKNNVSKSSESKVLPLGEDLGGDSFLYLYTDGYADQFGGPKGKKFKYKQLDELLMSISNLPVYEQSEILNNRFEEWKGMLEQIDDVLLIGIKL